VAVLYAGHVTPLKASRFLDITLTELFRFADISKSLADKHRNTLLLLISELQEKLEEGGSFEASRDMRAEHLVHRTRSRNRPLSPAAKELNATAEDDFLATSQWVCRGVDPLTRVYRLKKDTAS